MATQDTAIAFGVDQDNVVKDPEESERRLPAWKRVRAACGVVLFAPNSRKQAVACALSWVVIVVAILALLVWLIPMLVTNAIVPLTNKLRKALTPPQIGALLAGLLIFMPMVFLPPYPFIWLCAPLLGLWPCFAIVEVSTTVGMLLTFTLGRTLMRHKAEDWARKRPALQAAFNALDRVGPFKTLVLLRLSPMPYALINYCATVPPSMSLRSFMLASVLALIPRHFLWVYFGRHLKGLAAFLRGQPMPASQMVYNVVVLAVAFIIIIGAAVFASIRLRRIREQGRTAEQAPAGAKEDPEAQKDRPQYASSTASTLTLGQPCGSDQDSATDAPAAAGPPTAGVAPAALAPRTSALAAAQPGDLV